jgi:alginate O-acetyltransferase complex protein AlgI
MFGAGASYFDKTALYYASTGLPMLIIATICATPVVKKLRDLFLRILPGRIVVSLVYIGLLLLCFLFLVVDNYNPFLYFRF